MANVPIRSMTQTGTPDASSQIVFDNGTMRRGTVGSMADAVRPVASQSEAQAGSDNTKTMTPLRVKDSIAAEIGVSIASKAQGDLANTALQGSSLGSGVVAFLTTPSSANLRAALIDETGSGAAVFGTSPNITTPTGIVKNDVGLGNVDNTSDATKWAATKTLTNTTFDTLGAGNIFRINGSTISNITGTGSAVLANSPTLVTPNLGTPSAVTLTNGTGLPVSTGISGLATGIATFLATPSSANLAAALTDETGTGANVFANAPTLVNPVVGTQAPGNNTALAASTAFVTAAVASGGGGSGATSAYDTRTVAIATIIPSTTQGIMTYGYSNAGDGGGARYRKVGSIAAGKLGFTSADGANWEIAETAINVDMAGAKGDGTTDDSVAIRAAIASVPRGGDLLFTAGKTYGVTQDGATAGCLNISNPINLIGVGGYTNIKPLSVANTVDVIVINGSTTVEDRFTTITNLFIGDPSTGQRTGRHGIVLRTAVAGSFFRRITVEKNFICPQASPTAGHRGIFCDNNATNVPNGGIYTSVFQNNTIGQGIFLSQSGDTIAINDCAFYGINPGIEVDLVANATGPYIRGCNIVNTGGAVKINRAYGFVIDGGIYEPISGSGSNGAVIDINGGSSTVIGGLIQNVVFVPLGGATFTRYIRIRNSQMIRCQMNEMPGSGITCHDIASSLGTVIGKSIIGSGNTYVADDGGSQTTGAGFYIGNAGRPAFQNSWSNFGSTTTTLRFYKDMSGFVHIEGYVTGGTLSSVVFTLPVGYRPSAFVANPPGTVQVNAAGQVFSTHTSNTQVNMAVSFLAADEGHLFV